MRSKDSAGALPVFLFAPQGKDLHSKICRVNSLENTSSETGEAGGGWVTKNTYKQKQAQLYKDQMSSITEGWISLLVLE